MGGLLVLSQFRGRIGMAGETLTVLYIHISRCSIGILCTTDLQRTLTRGLPHSESQSVVILVHSGGIHLVSGRDRCVKSV